MGETAVLGGIALASAVYGGVSSADQQRSARLAGDRQQEAQDKAEKQLKDQAEVEKADLVRSTARARQDALRRTAAGRKSTILTSPTSLIGAPTASPVTAIQPTKSLIGT